MELITSLEESFVEDGKKTPLQAIRILTDSNSKIKVTLAYGITLTLQNDELHLEWNDMNGIEVRIKIR
jgi:hypothetical protein